MWSGNRQDAMISKWSFFLCFQKRHSQTLSGKLRGKKLGSFVCYYREEIITTCKSCPSIIGHTIIINPGDENVKYGLKPILRGLYAGIMRMF